MTALAPLAFAILSFAQGAPKAALEAAANHYKGLNSFAADIESHDASGLFPGNYEQSLKWRKGGRFELKITKKTDFVPKDGEPGAVAPDYFSNGKEVFARRLDGSPSTRALDTGPNVSPGWEVSGGPILMYLLDSWSSRFLLNPPEGFKVEYTWGDRKEWEEAKVREVVLNISAGPEKRPASIFLDERLPQIVGQEYTSGGKRHWLRYRNAVNNPELPSTLGEHPKS